MKCSSLKHSESETKILSLGDTRACIGPMMQSPRLLLTRRAPKSLPSLRAHHWATAVTILMNFCTQLNPQARLEQLKLSKTRDYAKPTLRVHPYLQI
jgi:hypothetical protein